MAHIFNAEKRRRHKVHRKIKLRVNKGLALSAPPLYLCVKFFKLLSYLEDNDVYLLSRKLSAWL